MILRDQRRLVWRRAHEYAASRISSTLDHRGRRHTTVELTHTTMRVLHALLWEFSSPEIFPSYETLAQLAGVSRSSVARAIAALRLAGFLTWARALFHSNRYQLHLPAKRPEVHSATGPQVQRFNDYFLRRWGADWPALSGEALAKIGAKP